MDKKSSNTGISKSLLRSLNRSYVSEPIKDENKIAETMSKFLTGELDTIKSTIESNEILNFKDSTGQTLIHAIIRNESPNITEENKLQIIRMLFDKNVSLNSMTQLNQNPLHLACQKGYPSIIIYLLTNGCDQKLNDNNGNAPIHFLIDKFIDTCKQDDLYKPSNKEIKSINSGQIKKINEIIKKQNLNILIKLFEPIKSDDNTKSYTFVSDGKEIIDYLNKLIKYSTQNLLPMIYTIIDGKISDIKKIFVDLKDSNENKLSKAKNIILNTRDEIKKIYKYNLDDNTIMWDSFILNQKIKAISNKKNYIEKINENIKKIEESLDNQFSKIENIKDSYYHPFINYICSINYVTFFIQKNGNEKRLQMKILNIPEKYLLPTTYAFDTSNQYLDIVTDNLSQTYEQFHYGLSTIKKNEKNNKELDLVLLEGSNHGNYGLLNLDICGTVDFDSNGNVVCDNSQLDKITINNFVNNIFNDFLSNFSKDVSGNILTNSDFEKTPDVGNDEFKTILCNHDLQFNLHTVPFNLEDDIYNGIIYFEGFSKLSHPKSDFFEDDDDENKKKKGNKNVKLWVYNVYLQSKPLDQETYNKLDETLKDKDYVIEELKQLQTKRNNSFINKYIGDNTKLLSKFVENTLENISNIDPTKVKNYYENSLENSKSEMIDQVPTNKELVMKIFSKSIISDQNTKNAIGLNTELAIGIGNILFEQIPRIILYELNNEMIRVNNHQYPFIPIKQYCGFIQQIQLSNIILRTLFLDDSVQPLVQYIVSNNELMDRINQVAYQQNQDNALITHRFFTRIKNFYTNNYDYKDKQCYEDLWNMINSNTLVQQNIMNQIYPKAFDRVRTIVNDLINLCMVQFIFNKIYEHITTLSDFVDVDVDVDANSVSIIQNINTNINNLFENRLNLQSKINTFNIILTIFNNINPPIPYYAPPQILYLEISVDVYTIYNNLQDNFKVPNEYIEIITGVALILWYNYKNSHAYTYTLRQACEDANKICTIIINNINPDAISKQEYNLEISLLTPEVIIRRIDIGVSGINLLIKNQIVNIIQNIAQVYSIIQIILPPNLLIDDGCIPIQIPGSVEKEITNIIITQINTIVNSVILVYPAILTPEQQAIATQLLNQNTTLISIRDPESILNSSKSLVSSGIGLIVSFGNDTQNQWIRYIISKTIWELITLRQQTLDDDDDDDIIQDYIGIPSVIANISTVIASFGNKLITTKLIEEYLPNSDYLDKINFNYNPNKNQKLFNTKFFWTINKYFKYIPILNLITYIQNSIKTIKSIIIFNINEENFRDYIHKFNLLYVKQFTNILVSIINNLVILEKYILQINFEDYNKLINNSNELIKCLLDLSKSNDSTQIITMLSNIISIHETTLSTSMEKIKDNELQKQISKIYNEIIKVLGIFGELVENINKYQSELQLEKYNEFIDGIISNGVRKPDITILNTLFNNYTWDVRKKFPDNYDLYKKKYFDINPDVQMYELKDKTDTEENFKTIFKFNNYPCNLIQDAMPFTSTCNFNIFYNQTNPINTSILEFDNNFEDQHLLIEKKDYDFEKFSLNDISGNKFNDSTYHRFATGYDINNGIISYDNIYKDDLIKLNKDKNELCDIDNIKGFSNMATNKVQVDPGYVAKYFFSNKLEINKIDFCTYLLTNNLGEIVNLIVYLIYSKFINDQKLMGLFFSKSTSQSLKLYETGTTNTIDKNISIGIDLEEYQIDNKYKTNIFDTLEFIKTNEKEKKNYILENIKIFVKIILDTQINNQIGHILKEIKINNPFSSENMVHINSNEITIFNNNISKIKLKYNETEIMYNILKSFSLETLEYNQLIRIIKNTPDDKNSNKLIGNKCINRSMTDELLDIGFNYKILDLNGNTILNRLIDQYNLYGINKIIKSKPFLRTYKNNNDQTPVEYLLNLMSNIQNDYKENNLEQRIKKYSTVITNLIKSNELFKNILLEKSENLIREIIVNSICLFNEIMWLKLYEFPTGWELSDKKELKEILGIEKEELLIVTFNFDENPGSDIGVFETNEKSELENKLGFYTEKLTEEINDYENKINQYNSDASDLLISSEDISGNIYKYDELKKTKNNIMEEYKKYIGNLKSSIDESIKKIKSILTNSEYKEKKLIKSTNLNWEKYEKMVFELDSNYLKIIKILNVKTKNKNMISNFLQNIIKYDIKNNETNKINIINKYFNKIFDNVFADYWDLDRYEDSSYNILNESLLEILKVNVVEIISNELFNTLINYIIQKNIYSTDVKDIIEKIKSKFIGSNTILDSIRKYLYDSIITKLGQKNPDKSTYIDLNTQKKITMGEFNSLVKSVFDSDDMVEIDKIFEFNKFLCESIAYNCYEEIIKILYDCKKISIQYKIFDEIKI
jgi:hypothetical protein